jgi:hypothetical protein
LQFDAFEMLPTTLGVCLIDNYVIVETWRKERMVVVDQDLLGIKAK